MDNLRKVIYNFIMLTAVLVALASILSMLVNTDNRYLKMLDFPRIQLFVLSIVSLIVFPAMTKQWRTHDTILAGCLALGVIIQGTYIVNYTPLVGKEVADSVADPNSANVITLLMINVKQSNRSAQPLLDLIERQDPDLVLAMETDAWWDRQLTPVQERYPHVREAINDKTYGMVLYSKYELKNVAVENLNHEEIPTFDCTLRLANGNTVELIAVHPPPPTYFEDIPDNEGKEEKTMLKVGDKVRKSKLPTIVAGDFNDVAWSKTNNMTKAGGQLNDVRVGRWFYNSFDATSWYLRWPLDHVFVTKEFKVHKLQRMEKVGSDHFPIYVELVVE